MVDIQVVWSPSSPIDLEAFLHALDVDDATVARSRGAAINQACAALRYYLDTYPLIVERSWHKLASLGVRPLTATLPAFTNAPGRSVSAMRGPLETRYLEVHPGATAGLDACRYLERHPGRWFTHAELKSALGCSDRIIWEHLPEALNSGESPLLEVDRSQRAWEYRYPGARA